MENQLYDAYGAGQSDAAGFGHAGPFGYKAQWGYYTDRSSGLILCTHRFYDPLNGRWLNRDPIGQAGGINLYVYCNNDPVNNADPSGLDDTGYEAGWQTGSYFGDVGAVFKGYGDALNPVNWYNGMAGLFGTARSCGVGAAASALGSGLYHGFTDWATTSDPRTFGQSFGTVLMAATGKAAPFAKTRLYRGIASDHPGYAAALQGRAVPRGGHSDPALHNSGFTASVYTSWTSRPGMAKASAQITGKPGGAVLRKDFSRRQLIKSPDKYGEAEVLIKGPVTGAKVRRL